MEDLRLKIKNLKNKNQSTINNRQSTSQGQSTINNTRAIENQQSKEGFAMKWFINLTTRAKLVLGFGLIWILLSVVIIIAYVSFIKIEKSEKVLYDLYFTEAVNLVELRSYQNYNRGQILEMMLTADRSEQDKIEGNLTEGMQQVDAILEGLLKLDPDHQFQSQLKELKNIKSAYRQTRQQGISLINGGKIEEAKQLFVGVQDDRFDKMRSITLELGDRAKDNAEDQIALDMQTAGRLEILFVLIGVAAFILGGLLVAFMNRAIAKPLSEITGIAELIAGGDLSVVLAGEERKDEVGLLANSFGRMVENLRRTTSDISEAVNLLGSSASEIMASTTQVASGTAETATAISETTTTVEEVRQAGQLSSKKAQNVSEIANRVAQVSRDGQKAVGETAAGMRNIREQMDSIAATIVRLSEQGQSIGGIIAVVNDIADQSNLLSVNAAIEAARAGEQGKSFAVVAQEIRSLAEQSKQATTQVREILSDVQKATSAAVMATEQGTKAVEIGVRQSAQAGEAIKVLAEGIGEAVQAATQIAASSQQQVVGMDQIGTAMENINQAGAETAASMRQMETAARNLNELGQKLKQLVEQYKV
jgi:methyl-accepting chemotaxis protein